MRSSMDNILSGAETTRSKKLPPIIKVSKPKKVRQKSWGSLAKVRKNI